MAVLRKVGDLTQKLFVRNKQCIYVRRNLNDDPSIPYDAEQPELKGLIPDPYPKTKKDWERSAEKYNLHPDEYKPYPPDHRYTGDYPELPMMGTETRDPFYPWDYPASRRNYGEAVHKRFDMMTEDRYDYGVRKEISDYKAAAIFWGLFLTAAVLNYLSPETSQPMMEKQYPGKGEHYTFELVK